VRGGAGALNAPARAALLFATLLVPTTAMGLSLPLLSRALTTDLGLSADRIGALYGWNTVGAALGSVVTVFGLVRVLGFSGAVGVGAGMNALCALAGVACALRMRDGAGAPRVRAAGRIPPAARASGDGWSCTRPRASWPSRSRSSGSACSGPS
jgi:hypothetical protein